MEILPFVGEKKEEDILTSSSQLVGLTITG